MSNRHDFSYSFCLPINLLLHCKFQLKLPCGLLEDVQNRFSRWPRWQPSWISNRYDFSSFQPEVILLLQSKFRLKSTKIWKEMSKSDFQDGGCGGHLGFLIGSVLAILCLQGAPILLIKFQLNWITVCIIVFSGDVQNI